MADAAERDTSPTRTGTAVAAVTAALAVLALAVGGAIAALLPALLGLGVLLVGLRLGKRRAVTAGALLGALAVLLAAALGGATLPVLGATVALTVAWDAAETAVTNGEQVGANAPTGRSERTHLAVTGGVLSVGAGGSFAVYRLATGGLPTAAALALLVGGVLLVVVLGR